jgi:hypothetical protein
LDGDPAFQLNPKWDTKISIENGAEIILSGRIAKRRIKQKKAKEIVIWADEYLKWY